MSKIHPTAYISPNAIVGENVEIGPFTYVHEGTTIGDNTVIQGWCEIGRPFSGFTSLTIGENSIIRSHSIIYTGSTYGKNLKTGHHVTLRENMIVGESVQFGSYNDIQGDCVIGNFLNCQSNVFMGKYTKIGNFCWVFPSSVFTNDPHPPSHTMVGATMEDFAVVASHCTILPGITIGRGSLVGAHSLVNRNVTEETLVVGVPAKERGPVSMIKLKDNPDQSAYPWTTHYRDRFPKEITDTWPTSELPS